MVEKVFIENLRKSALAVRFEERKSLVISRKRKLQELYAACRHIDRTKPFPSADIVQTWGTIENYDGANMEEGEKKFLEENDLEKGRLFRESTLPPHSSYLPEPGGFPKRSTFKAVSSAASKQSQHVAQPAVRSPQALEMPAIAQKVDLADKGLPHASVDRKESGDISLAEPVTTNGNRMGEGMDVPMIDKPGACSGTEEEDLGPSDGTAESVPEEVRSESVVVVDVGGIPVQQESATRVPDEKERSTGVHLPPIPAELVNKLLDDPSVIAEAPPKSGPESSVESPEPISKSPVAGPSGDTAGEIPDSYESPQSSSLSDAPTSPSSPKGTALELRQEPRLTEISPQSPPQPPLAVITTEENHPLPIPLLQPRPTKSFSHQEASSPVSSIDGGDAQSTPGNVISSATSPDASHIPDPEPRLEGNNDPKGLVLDSVPYGSSLPAKEVEKEEPAGVLARKDTASHGAQCKKPLSSVLIAGGAVRSEKETQSRLPVIPSTETTDAVGSGLAAVEVVAAAIPVSELDSDTIVVARPPSPNPSAQLRLESSFVRSGAEGAGMPGTIVCRLAPEDLPAAKPHDEEVEDQVQLVGISRPELGPGCSKGLVELVKKAVGEMTEKMEVDDPAPTIERGRPGVSTRSESVWMSGTGQPPSPERVPPPTWGVIPALPLTTPKRENLRSPVLPQIGRLKVEVEPAIGEEAQKPDETSTTGPLPLPLPALGEIGAGLSRGAGAVVVPCSGESGPGLSGNGVNGENPGIPPAPLIPSVSPAGGIPRHKEPERKRAKLSKVVISSTHHALAAAEEEAKRLQEDQISQGIIVVARRRDQQAASAAGRGRSAVFQPGSKIDAITRYGIADPPSVQREKKKSFDSFDVLHTYKASGTSVADLLQKSSKTLTTSDHQVHYFESQAVRIESRIQDLQDQGLWSLRQIPRVAEPRRRKCHWDYLLEEAKWLRDDFKGERRWKLAQARYLSKMVLQWYYAGEDRNAYTVDRKRYGVVPRGLKEERKGKATTDVEMADQPTPDLVNGGASPESDCDFPADDMQEEGCFSQSLFEHIDDPPAAIFTLSPEEAVFVMPHTKAADDLLGQMPLYAPPQPPAKRPEEIEEEWTKSPIVAVTKYATGRMQLQEEQQSPPRKRSRYEYDENYDLFADDSDEDERLSGGRLIGGNGRDKTQRPLSLPPEQTNVALFRPEYKPILQRLHNTHVPRTPSDFPPPSFFESRVPSLWQATEDEMLKTLVREYHYNWGLISQCLTLEGMWHSGSERRSPWECFERWISLEQVPQEFLKSPFFKPIQQRLDVASKVSSGLYGNLTSSTGGGVVKPRRGTAPIRVEKRRVTKYYNLIESMRKLAKKRETSVNKQQTNKSQVIAAIKRASENPSSNTSQLKTPQYFSSIKYEREQKQQEQQKNMYSQPVQGITQPRGSQVLPPQARVPPHPGQHPGLPNGVPIAPQQRVSLPVPQVANGLPQVGRAGPMSNGTNGIPVRTLPAQLPQGRYTPEQIAQYRFRLAQQAQLAQQQQQQQAGYQVSTSQIGSVQVPQGVAPNMQAMLHQAQQAALGQPQPKPRIVPPPLDPQAQTSAPSPRMPPTPTTATNPQPKSQHLAPLSVQEMAAFVQLQHPGLPQEQIHKAAQQTLATYHAQLSQTMQARTPNRACSGRTAVNTGPMIGVNGPVNPMNEGSPRIGQMASPRVTPTAPNQPHQPST